MLKTKTLIPGDAERGSGNIGMKVESNEKAAPADFQGKVCSSRKISYERASTSAIKDVWIGEFFNELAVLSQLIEHDYNIVSFVS
jgi:hypothetical protein